MSVENHAVEVMEQSEKEIRRVIFKKDIKFNNFE